MLLSILLVLPMTYGGAAWISALAAQNEDQERLSWEFRSVERVQSAIRQEEALLASLRGFFDASDFVTEAEFREYAEATMWQEVQPGLVAVEFIRLVEFEDLEAFAEDRQAYFAGLGYDFDVFTLSGEDPFAINDTHYIMDYVYPLEGNEGVLGLDNAGNSSRMDAIEASLERGLPFVSDPLVLLQTGDPGYLVYEPVYRDGVTLGFAVAVYDVETFVTSSIGDYEDAFPSVVVDGVQSVYGSHDGDARFYEVAFFGRSLSIGFVAPSPTFLYAFIGFMFGLASIVTAAVAVAASRFAIQQEAIRQKVDEQTVELRRQTEELQVKNKELQKAKSLEEANEVLRRSNRDLESFAFVASHDLQEPLRKLAALTSLVKESPENDLSTASRAFLDQAHHAAKDARRLIQDLLAFARVGQGAVLVETDLDLVLRDALQDLEQMRELAGATIEHDALPTVSAAPGLLKQVFVNLLSNAMKYTQPGRLPEIHISAHKLADGSHRIDVQDRGPGIPPDQKEDVFKIFRRLEKGAEHAEGTGLGLAICRRIAEFHGGRLDLESTEGVGSTFQLFLPAASEGSA